MEKERRATHPFEIKYLPHPTETWSNLDTAERTQIKRGIEKPVEPSR